MGRSRVAGHTIRWFTSAPGQTILALVGIVLGVAGLLRAPVVVAVLAGAFVIAAVVAYFLLRRKLGDPYEMLSGLDHWVFGTPTADTVTVRRTLTLRFLHDNVISMHDFARGDGQVGPAYDCSPSHFVAVDHFKDGEWYRSLISFRRAFRRGEQTTLSYKRDYAGSFESESEWIVAELASVTHDYTIRVDFHPERPPVDVWFSCDGSEQKTPIGLQNVDGVMRADVRIPAPARDGKYLIVWRWPLSFSPNGTAT